MKMLIMQRAILCKTKNIYLSHHQIYDPTILLDYERLITMPLVMSLTLNIQFL